MLLLPGFLVELHEGYLPLTLMEPNWERYLAGALTLTETMKQVPSACAYSVVDEDQQGLALASEVLERFPINSFFCRKALE